MTIGRPAPDGFRLLVIVTPWRLGAEAAEVACLLATADPVPTARATAAGGNAISDRSSNSRRIRDLRRRSALGRALQVVLRAARGSPGNARRSKTRAKRRSALQLASPR